MAEEDPILTDYYLAQAGSGMGDLYSGPIYQKGYGIGSFLGGLFRGVLPLLKRGGVAVGKEILNAGTNFITDLQNNMNPRDALNMRARETIENLKRKALYGEGFIRYGQPRKRQLRVGGAQGQKKKKKRVTVKKRVIGNKKKKKPVKKRAAGNKKKKSVKKRDIFSI